MNRIQHIFEPGRIWLVWQANSPERLGLRRVVAEILRPNLQDSPSFHYLQNTDDFQKAREEGFEGYPAFKLSNPVHTQGVLEAFMRRLPPRSREDFDEYLIQHRLPQDFNFSDMALLAYTGGKLPGDRFEFCVDFDEAPPPLEMVIEIAGFRHQTEVKASALVLDEPVSFIPEPNNQHDRNAISICYRKQHIGYISRAHTHAFHNWINQGYALEATIERINGKPERPLIYLFVKVR
jgi:HIRAN domain